MAAASAALVRSLISSRSFCAMSASTTIVFAADRSSLICATRTRYLFCAFVSVSVRCLEGMR